MVINGSNDHSIVLNNFGEFTDRCISGVLSESNPGVRKLGVLLFLLFLPTGDGASTLGGLFSVLSPMNGVLTREFLHCFIWWSPEDSLRVGIQCLNHGCCISNGSFGNIEIQLH